MKFRDSVLLLAVMALATPAFAATVPAKPVAAKPAAKKPAAAKPAPAPVPDLPVDPVALTGQARVAAARGDTDLALRLAQSVIVATPAQPGAYNLLADIYAGMKQPEAARNYYNLALSIDPADMTATQGLSALDKAGDSRAANADGAKSPAP